MDGAWDARNFELIATLTGHSDFVLSAEFSPDSRTLVTASSDSVRLWEATTGMLEATLRSEEQPSKEGKFDIARFSPDGRTLAVGGYQSPALLLNLDWLLPVRQVLPRAIVPEAATISEDGQHIWQINSQGENAFWDVEDRSNKPRRGASAEKLAYTHSERPAFARDGELLITRASGVATDWNVKTGKSVGSVEANESKSIGQSLATSKDGRFLATLSREDHSILVWDLRTLTQLASLRGHSDDVVQVQFSPDSRLLATGSADRAVKVWNTSDWSLFRSLDNHGNVISALAFSPNSKRLAVGTTVGTLHIWDLEAKASIVSRVQYDDWRTVAFSPDGSRLIASNGDNFTWLWAPDSIQPIAKLNGAAGIFSRDGSRVATADASGAVRMWRSRDGALISTTRLDGKNLLFLGFSKSDAEVLVSYRGQSVVALPGTLPNTAEVYSAVGARTNLRVCRDTYAVVPVTPFPKPDTSWAPENACKRAQEQETTW